MLSVVAFISGVFPIAISARWLLWYLCFLAMLVFASSLELLAGLSGKLMAILGSCLVVAFLLIKNTISMEEWKAEQVAAVMGRLTPAHDKNPPRGASRDGIVMTIGPVIKADYHPLMIQLSGEGTHWTPAGSSLKISRRSGILTIDTEVRNRNGELIAQVIDNDWRIFPQMVSEINYTSNALEIKDRRGFVVLKVMLFDDYVQIEGEWWREGGSGIRMLRPKPYSIDYPGPILVEQSTPGYMPDTPQIYEMSRYPSDKYSGEPVDRPLSWANRIFLIRVLGFYLGCRSSIV